MKIKMAILLLAVLLVGVGSCVHAETLSGTYPVAYVEAADGSGSVSVFPSPSEKEAYAQYNNGTKVLIIETEGEWCKVFCGLFLFIREENLKKTGAFDKGFETIGFAVADFEPSAAHLNANGHTLCRGTCEITPGGGDIPNGDTVKLIAFAGDMLQIDSFGTEGFAFKEHFKVFLWEDLLTAQKAEFLAGTHKVGEDIPQGLYVFDSPDGARAEIHIQYSKHSNTMFYEVSGKNHNTLYLPMEAKVTVSESGRLTQAGYHHQIKRQSDQIEGNQRLLTGYEISALPEVIYRVVAVEGAQNPYFRVSTLVDDSNGVIAEMNVIHSEAEVYLLPGEFIELHECTLIPILGVG